MFDNFVLLEKENTKFAIYKWMETGNLHSPKTVLHFEFIFVRLWTTKTFIDLCTTSVVFDFNKNILSVGVAEWKFWEK